MSEITPPSSFRFSGARSPSEARRGWQKLRRGKYAPLIAFGFTIAAFGIILLVVLTSETWPRVQKQFFNWNKFTDSWDVVSGAFWLDIRMFVIAEAVILVFALLLAVLRSLRGPEFFPLRALTVIYIDIFRGVPLLLIILLLGFGVPALQISCCPTERSSGASRLWCSPIRLTQPRCIARASSRCTKASDRQLAR